MKRLLPRVDVDGILGHNLRSWWIRSCCPIFSLRWLLVVRFELCRTYCCLLPFSFNSKSSNFYLLVLEMTYLLQTTVVELLFWTSVTRQKDRVSEWGSDRVDLRDPPDPKISRRTRKLITFSKMAEPQNWWIFDSKNIFSSANWALYICSLWHTLT